jgi:CPA2 family monovalent cation:H+ antiporter-2
MTHDTTLIATIVAAFVLALAFGFLAVRVRVPPLVGYLLAGIALGPFTPGLMADAELAAQLAEIGVVLLMFGIGLHFSFNDLLETRRIALPGALAQMAAATAIGTALAIAWGWDVGAGVIFGLSLSVASSVVLLRALEQRNALDSPEGKVAMGWLIVEDVAMVLVVVILPVVAQPEDGRDVATAILVVLVKVAVFVALALVVGTRFVPWLLTRVSRTGSGELFTLAVLAIALGIAYGSAELFDVSLALGAFFAGVVLSESDLSQRAAADSLPLKDAFAVLFFVSVGMLFDPSVVLDDPLSVLAVLLIILLGKSAVAFAVVRAFGYPANMALTISASLAQIGEFSFILAGMGVAFGILPVEGRDLVLAGSILSIALNPLAFLAIPTASAWLRRASRSAEPSAPFSVEESIGRAPSAAKARDHAVIVGYGRVGRHIGPMLERVAAPFVVVERDRALVARVRERGAVAVYGDACSDVVLEAAGIRHARLIVISTPDGFQSRRILEIASALNPRLKTVMRADSEAELTYLQSMGVSHAVTGQRQLALALGEFAVACFAPGTTGDAPDRSAPQTPNRRRE